MKCPTLRSLASVTLLILCLSGGSLAQTRPVSGYVQNVPVWTAQTPLARSNFLDLTRIRLMANPVLGPVSVNAAYEHLGTLRQRTATVLPGVGAVPAGGEWLDLAWTIGDSAHVGWQHRFDRLHLTWSPTGAFQLTLGRQAISWGTTLFLTPADPFVPFLPSDPFREYRAGVDAVRARIYPGPLSEIDLVVRPTKTALGEEWTTLARGLTTLGNWELSGWAGSLYGDPAGAFGASGSAGSWAVRSEAEVRRSDQGIVFRGTVGVDHLSQIHGRDLYLIVEYQRDGMGAARAGEYPMLLSSRTFLRGEHQVLGRDETFVQATYQLHPLWSLGGLWIRNLGDGSSLISPSFTHSAGNNASITGGVFFSTGNDRLTPSRPIPSEYGVAGKTGFIALNLYF